LGLFDGLVAAAILFILASAAFSLSTLYRDRVTDTKVMAKPDKKPYIDEPQKSEQTSSGSVRAADAAAAQQDDAQRGRRN
jgi:hypothetical protein